MQKLLLFCLLISFVNVSAQIIVSPLHYNSLQAEFAEKHARMKTTAVSDDTLKIPFWEDFVNSGINPDTLWVPGGGTFINNSYPYNQINFNVASFDGLNAKGVPYNKADIFATGPCDSLTSRPIDLSSAGTGSKPVYMRFSWQAGGLGDIPDQISDSLRLQFKNSSGKWITEWTKNNLPETDDSTFTTELLTITNTQYLYKGFQFRFQSFGKQAGNYDVWNVDYIMLDTGVIAHVDWAPEFAYRTASHSMLKDFTSMPVWQYEANINGETANTLEFEVVNLRQGVFGYEINPSASYLKNLKGSSPTQFFPAQSSVNFNGREAKKFSYTVNKSNITANGMEKKFEYRSTVKANIDPLIGDYFDFVPTNKQSDINYSVNDTIKGFTTIKNYYSYDDGTAEAGIGVNQNLGRIAVQYRLNVADTIKSVQICFPDIGKDFVKTSIVLIVWEGITPGQKTEQILGYEVFQLEHGPTLNGFYEFIFKNPIRIPNNNSVIYVGYQQSIDEAILVGFDKNIDTRNKIFYNVKDTWSQYNGEFGSIMIRPNFRTTFVTSNKQQKETLEANVYPNPTQGEITVAGKIKQASVYDLTGRLVHTITFEDEFIYDEHRLDLSDHSNGLYLLHLESSVGKVVKKIYINK